MNKVLKFKNGDDIWFVSDTHFHHHKEFLIGPRGYKTVEEHDEGLVNAWNAVVPSDGIVFFLGDWSFYVYESAAALKYIEMLNFKTLYMLWGNHNAGIRQLYSETMEEQWGRTDIEVYPLHLPLDDKRQVVFLGHYQELVIENNLIVLSHFAFRNFNHNADGAWNLCGHSHGNDSGINGNCPDRKVLDVSVDRYGAPVSYNEVKHIMKYKRIETNDHHVDQKTQGEKK